MRNFCSNPAVQAMTTSNVTGQSSQQRSSHRPVAVQQRFLSNMVSKLFLFILCPSSRICNDVATICNSSFTIVLLPSFDPFCSDLDWFASARRSSLVSLTGWMLHRGAFANVPPTFLVRCTSKTVSHCLSIIMLNQNDIPWPFYLM